MMSCLPKKQKEESVIPDISGAKPSFLSSLVNGAKSLFRKKEVIKADVIAAVAAIPDISGAKPGFFPSLVNGLKSLFRKKEVIKADLPTDANTVIRDVAAVTVDVSGSAVDEKAEPQKLNEEKNTNDK